MQKERTFIASLHNCSLSCAGSKLLWIAHIQVSKHFRHARCNFMAFPTGETDFLMV